VRGLAVAGGLALGAAVLAPPAHAAGWSPPRTLAAGKVGLLGLSVAPNGRTAVAWQTAAGLEVAIGRKGRLGPPQVVSRQTDAERLVHRERVQLAIAPTGVAALVWQSTPRRGAADPLAAVWVAFRPAGGGWEAPRRLAAAAYWPQIGIDAAGNATVTWFAGPLARTQGVERPAGGAWGTPFDIGQGGADPRLAVAADGRAAVVWSGGGISGALRAGAHSGFGPAQTIAGPSTGPADGYSGARVRFDAAGRVVATWHHSAVLETSATTAGGSWSSPAVDQPGYAPLDAGDYEAPRASDAAGDEFAAWWAGTRDGSRSVVQVARRPVAGAFEATQTLAVSHAALGLSRPPALAVTAAGAAVVVWQQRLGARVVTRAALRRAGSTRFGPAAAIDRRPGLLSDNPYAGMPQVAVDRAGVAVAAWQTCTTSSRCTLETATVNLR